MQTTGFYVRMTSCVLPLFVLVFLCSSITAFSPTGLRVRVTDKAQRVVKDLGLTFFEEMINKPLPDFTMKMLTLTELKLTEFSVNPAQVHFGFQQNSGLSFQIKQLNMSGEFHRRVPVFGFTVHSTRTVFGVQGVRAAIGVKLTRTKQGRLNVMIPHCHIQVDEIILESSSFLGRIIDFFNRLFKNFVIRQICSILQSYIVPEINTMLEDITMVAPLPGGQNLSIDYSLSGDASVTSYSLDVPFKGLVFRQGDALNCGSIIKGTDPRISEKKLMAYIGVSDFLLKSGARALYGSGAFRLDVPKLTAVVNTVLEAVGLPVGPFDLDLTEVPTIDVSPAGLSVRVNARAQSLAQPRPAPLPLTCKVHLSVSINGNHLMLDSNTVMCTVKPSTFYGKLLAGGVNIGINKHVKSIIHDTFGEGAGLLIPLPTGVDFTQAKINYHEGFILIGGNLKLTPDGRKRLLKAIGR